MGQEESRLVDDNTPPQSLKRRDIQSVAEYINSGRAKQIVAMVGAGISTSAGIPDFRSPDTGLYANLARLDLPYPEAVFDISFFRENPLPFYTLAHELFPGKYRPTITHSFLRLLHDKGLLLKLFTQNIDILERVAGIPEHKIVKAHGSFATHSCIECHASYPNEDMEKAILEKRVPRCEKSECGGLVKPDVVFFGQQLPESFFLNHTLPAAADMCIVLGTSLCVQPFASLPGFARTEVPRLLINSERVGGLGSRPDDVLFLVDCDTGVRKLAEALGWLDELEATWAKTQPEAPAVKVKESPKNEDERLEAEVEKLTAEVDATLKLSSDTQSYVKRKLAKDEIVYEGGETVEPKVVAHATPSQADETSERPGTSPQGPEKADVSGPKAISDSLTQNQPTRSRKG